MTLIPSMTKHFKRRESLSVKFFNDSQEIQDVSSALDDSQEMESSPVQTPAKSPKSFFSPGKYFSIATVTETSTGQIRMTLNRITKPHQTGGVTASKPGVNKRSPVKKHNYKDLIIPRLNRSAYKPVNHEESPREGDGNEAMDDLMNVAINEEDEETLSEGDDNEAMDKSMKECFVKIKNIGGIPTISSELSPSSMKKQKSVLSPESSYSSGKKNQKTKHPPKLSSSVEEKEKSEPSSVSSSQTKKRTASEKSISESPRKKSKIRNSPKKFVPTTPVLEATSKKQSEPLPTPDSTPKVAESQNLLAMESETDYQSQSLLQPSTVPNKVKNYPKDISDKNNNKKAYAESKKGSSKSESCSLMKGSISTTSSDSSDDSDNEENLSRVTIPAKQTVAPSILLSSDSSSYDSDSTDDEHTITITVHVSNNPTRPRETAATKPDRSVSSKESPKTAESNKSNNAVTVPTLSGEKDAKKLGDSQIKRNSKSATKQSSSSSSSDSEEESPKPMLAVPIKKKMTKTKNHPKSASKTSTSLRDDKY